MTNFESVRKFMETFGQEVKKKPGFPNDKTTSLRYNLINEELEELKDAISKKDIKEVPYEVSIDGKKINCVFLSKSQYTWMYR